MSIHINELKPLKVYKSTNKMFLPLDKSDKTHGSLIYLLTPSLKSSIDLINSPLFINRNWFKSYYLEKSINVILTEENYIRGFVDDYHDFVDEVLIEEKLSSKDRKAIPDKDFGVSSKRKFPLNDEEHVRAAIRMFNHVDKEDEKELADKIIKKLKQFDITDIEVGEDNRFCMYYRPLKEEVIYKQLDGLTSRGYYKASEIKNAFDECRDLIHDEQDNYFECNYNKDIKYLGKMYDEDKLIGFIVATKAGNGFLDAKVYVSDDVRDMDDKADVGNTMILNFRGTMINLNKSYKFARIYYMTDDTLIMDKVAIKLSSLISQIVGFTGNINKNDHVIILPLNESNLEETCLLGCSPVHGPEMTSIGIQARDSAMVLNDYFNESNNTNENRLRKILYNERFKNQKQVISIYNSVKAQCPSIKYTKLDYSMYKGLNLFIDTSHYNTSFFNNNNFTGDRGVSLYLDLIKRLLNDKELLNCGYNYTRRTVFIPISGWCSRDSDIFDYTKNINPISIITRTLKKTNIGSIKDVFKNIDIVFIGDNDYFKVDFSSFEKKHLTRFISNITNILNNSVPVEDDIVKDTPEAIATDIIDRLETSQKINLYGVGVTGKSKEKADDSTIIAKASESEASVDKKVTEQKKKEVVDIINKAANNSTSVEDALDKLDEDEYLTSILKDISNEESNGVKHSTAREARISQLNKNIQQKNIKGKTIKALIEKSESIEDTPLPVTSIDINSINSDQWDNISYINFNKVYDIDEDIMSILNFFSTRSVPVAVRDIKVEDTSTSEDLIETWTVQCEDINGTRFQLKFDIPKFKANRFMRLRGNDKTINGQLMNLPIIKTEKDVCQITTNYNKIFFRVFGSALGKSNVVTDRLCKALNKYEGKAITIKLGSDKVGALKYDLPLDYIDLSSHYSSISYKGITFYFVQEQIRNGLDSKIDLTKGLPIGYDENNKKVIYTNGEDFVSNIVVNVLSEDPEFKRLYDEAKPGIKYSYSKASIMSTTIPVIVVASYCEGLISTLNKAGINFEITDNRVKYDKSTHDVIKFNDGYILYEVNYSSSLLMNGLKECNTEDYSIKEVNTKTMWTEMLDLFGGRIKADGLDNFYDLMFDPITIRTCEVYDIPSDFVSGLIYASNLLADSKYNKHADITGNRFRTNELIAGYTYKALSESYADYKTKLKKTGKAVMTIKQSAIIDKILTDNTTSDASTINDLCYAEAANTVSWKGLSGLNSERSYSLDKRIYDDSMNGILAMSTGFAGTVGENRQATVNMNIEGKRGYIKDNSDNFDNMNDLNSMCISECLTPMSTTHDDPFREAMSYTQRTKHDMRVAGGDPLLITNGMDDALSRFTPDVFSVNAKSRGKVVEMDDEHITVQYSDGTVDYVDLTNKVYKNSDGGFYTAIKLIPMKGIHLNGYVDEGEVIAYDPLSYTPDIGYDDNATYNQGTLAKIAIMTTDMGFEDSCVTSRYLSNALSSNVVTQRSISLSKNTNVYNLVKVGQKIEEGDSLVVIQNSFEDDDVNILLKNLVDDEETVTSLGRIPIKSDHTGIVEDIKIYRTCELDGMSESLRKIVTDYEKEKTRIRKKIEKYSPDKAKEYVNNYKLEQTGRLKNVEDGVLIEIYVSYKDDFSVGDKLIVLGAQKGVAKEVFEPGMEPVSSYRPNEPIDCVVSMRSFDARMITAPLLYCMMYKGLVELDRQVKDIMGIKHNNDIHKPEFIEKG